MKNGSLPDLTHKYDLISYLTPILTEPLLVMLSLMSVVQLDWGMSSSYCITLQAVQLFRGQMSLFTFIVSSNVPYIGSLL